jgi:WD40 repeat protein
MPEDSVLLGQLAEEFSERVRRGDLPAMEDYAARHPALAERIRALFPTLMLLEGMAGARVGEPATVAPNESAAGGALRPGQVFNHYRIEREIGHGGMGVVYEATHLSLDKRVALKVLPVLPGEGSAGLERFLREARTAAGLHHTNIVPVFDIGQAQRLPYFAMQLIDGRGLDKVLDEWQKRPPADLFREVARLGTQAADALAYAHQRGVIHRDVKPSNLLLDGQGTLWVTDFGLARRALDPALTQSGALVGTPRYMSPEQAEAAKRPVDHRTDVYSLGATLYELATRRPPFEGATPVDVLLQVIERQPVPPRKLAPALPRDLETVILKAMAKRPEDRYQTAGELADDLRRFLDSEPVRARRIGPAGRAVRWARRNPALATLTAAVALSLVLGAAVAGYFALTAARQRDLAIEARDEARDHLSRSHVEQAAALLASDRAGRREQALSLVAEAERLRTRQRATRPVIDLPAPAELRSVAVSALLTRDARVLREWPGITGALTPNNRWALMAHLLGDDKVQVWIADLEAERAAPPAGPLTVIALGAFAVSPDGKWLAVPEEDGGVTLHGLREEAHERLPAPQPAKGAAAHKCESLAFSPDGAHLAGAAKVDGQVRILLWDWQTRQGPRTLPVDPKTLAAAPLWSGLALAFSPDGRWLAFPTARGVSAVDLRAAGRVAALEFGEEVGPRAGGSFTLSDRLLAAAHDGRGTGRIVIWDLETGKVEARAVTDMHGPTLAFSPDGSRLAALDHDSDTIRFFRSATADEEWRQTVAGLRDTQFLRWHADGRALFTTRRLASLVLWEPTWDCPEYTVAAADKDKGRAFAFCPDGEFLAFPPGRADQPVLLKRWRDGAVRDSALFDRSPEAVMQFLHSPDGRQFAAVGRHVCVAWNAATGKELARLKWDGSSWFRSGAFTAEGHFLAHQSSAVWDVTAGRKVWQAPAGEMVAALSPDGRFLAVGPDGWFWEYPIIKLGQTVLSDLSQNRKVGGLQGADGWGVGGEPPTFSPDGRWLFAPAGNLWTSDADGRAAVWGVPDGRKHLTIAGTADVTCCAFSADGRLLAVGHRDGTAQVWDVARGEPVFHWKPHAGEVTALAFAPDSSALASRREDSSDVKVLDLAALRRQLAGMGLDW